MFNLIFLSLVVGLVALIIASLFDIKTMEVPDWLNLSLVAFAIGSSLILSIYHGYSHIIINSLLGLALGLVIGLLLFYTGQWGGGDTKLIIGLCALIGLSYSDLGKSIPTIILFLVNTLLVGAVYGLAFSFVKAVMNFKSFRQTAEQRLRSKEIFVIRIILLVIGIGAFAFLLITRSIESAFIFGIAMALFLFFYLWAFISIVEKSCMIKEVSVSALTEGDWIVGDVAKGKKVLLRAAKTGITLKQIELLKKYRIRKVTTKVGIPFVPSFLIAYILTFAFGNWLAFLLPF